MSNFETNDHFYLSTNALSLMNSYVGSTFVVKYGGSAMRNNVLQSNVVQDLCFLRLLGINIVLVHGGGFFINEWLSRLNIEPKFENGIRVTDFETMELAEMVLTGKINKELVSLFNQNNIFCVGLSGKDANLVQASAMFDSPENLTGKVDLVNKKILNLLLSNNCLPVIASIASDLQGNTYNVNADTVASAIASTLKADKLILLTDTPGILYDSSNYSTTIKDLNLKTIESLQLQHIISGGMIPKIQSSIDALKLGVESVHIIDGTLRHALLYEVFTSERIGSKIVL
uniref:Acetylglutamate kinase n=1 Tax=Ophidocladus simpliciusculus TaxID=1261574 RepID=A0A1Z1MJ35_9FLOR|nr:acetylglutamate kinase [Ophidocladus simpliciusculus]ARW66068.1 acetylglutamate kinase [Ophidocladus simpliciusculus]